MRIIGQLMILITVFVMLQACASTRMAEQLQGGKSSFENGDFKTAFRKLLPLACEGCAAAQYAVGYMYYYGYGTSQDSESGLFWMNRAAAQHYQPAIRALTTIRENKISEEPTQQLTAERSIKEDSDEVLKALAENKPVLPSSGNPIKETDENTLAQNTVANPHEVIDPENNEPAKQLAASDSDAPKQVTVAKEAADFNEEHKKKYTLQLMGSYELADLKRLQSQLHIADASYCAHTTRNGRDWYVLGYGKYPAPYLAKLALDDLPQNLRQMKPWVRQLDDMSIVA